MKVWMSGGSGFVGSHPVRAYVAAFGLDGDRLAFGPPEPPFPIPYDTSSLDARAAAAVLGVELPSLDEQLLAMTEEVPA